jgi:glycosyltransferase involved in cell wall biosynthesis
MITGIIFDAVRKSGGSYQMSINNLLTFVDNFKKNKIKYIVLTHKKNLDLDKLKIKYQIIRISIWDYIFCIFQNIKVLKFFLKIFNLYSSFEKKLSKKNIYLLIFFFTSWKAFLLKKINFTATILDTCHLDFQGKKKFKEINFYVFWFREYIYKNILPLAYCIITESDDLKKKIVKLYKLKFNSIISISNLPFILMKNKKKLNIKRDLLIKYNIVRKFYFYPAQFWEHKNHIIILKAIKKLKLKEINTNFIFCGKDQGNLKYINNKISEYGIQDNVKIIGYVRDDELLELYKLSIALVMPSYFGPTNIPPVEAWSLKVPVAYSSLNINHGKNAAVYFDPDSVNDLVKAILKLETLKIRNKLIFNGIKRFRNIKKENKLGHKKFTSYVSRLLENS